MVNTSATEASAAASARITEAACGNVAPLPPYVRGSANNVSPARLSSAKVSADGSSSAARAAMPGAISARAASASCSVRGEARGSARNGAVTCPRPALAPARPSWCVRLVVVRS
ncbi:hypothetical protein GCM10022224_103130 [Nonomuraea antimicrobica]|uniref:Uncharacterized protein n=1 Tax=Nonomuraea antimicrobica TaxID=561173 RepID=A0ABP7EKV7_9ACTN